MPDSIEKLSNNELLIEYHDTVHHLGICSARGQIDNQQQKEETALRKEILERLEDSKKV